MNKKGFEARTVTIALVIILFFIVIVYAGTTKLGGDIINKFRNSISDFNSSRPLTGEIQIFRYDLLNDKLQYFDGIDYFDFTEENLEFGDKIVNKMQLTADFKNYYYNRELPVYFELENRNNRILKPALPYTNEFSVQEFNEGKSYVLVGYQSDEVEEGDIQRYFILDLNNQLFETKNSEIKKVYLSSTLSNKDNGLPFEIVGSRPLVPAYLDYIIEDINGATEQKLLQNGYEIRLVNELFKQSGVGNYRKIFEIYYQGKSTGLSIESLLRERVSNQNGLFEKWEATLFAPSVGVEESQIFRYVDLPEQEIIFKVSKWRDSVFEKPMQLTYEDKAENIGKTRGFCIQKIDAYLVVNLAKTAEDGCELK